MHLKSQNYHFVVQVFAVVNIKSSLHFEKWNIKKTLHLIKW
jgi:hypothetical protein